MKGGVDLSLVSASGIKHSVLIQKVWRPLMRSSQPATQSSQSPRRLSDHMWGMGRTRFVTRSNDRGCGSVKLNELQSDTRLDMPLISITDTGRYVQDQGTENEE